MATRLTMEAVIKNDGIESNSKSTTDFKADYKWGNIIQLTILHLLFFWGLLTFPYTQKPGLLIFATLLGSVNGFGVTGGAHRLWTHRSYKAKLPLRIFLMLCYSSCGHNPLLSWVKDHRVHHKYSETDADPHNASRGFFFSHVGWLMMKKHPEVIRKGKEMDFSDVENDPVVQFHQKYFFLLGITFAFVIPTCMPPLLWGEDWWWSFVGGILRYGIILNFTWFVNSAAHIWGMKPYNRNIGPAENWWVSVVALGEGWHNYHHTFPWDYRAAEIGTSPNLTTLLLNMFAKIGWAYDFKFASNSLIKSAAKKHGDGSHPVWGTEIPYVTENTDDLEKTE